MVMRIRLTRDVIVNGADHAAGDVLDLAEEVALAVMASGAAELAAGEDAAGPEEAVAEAREVTMAPARRRQRGQRG